MAIQSNGSIKLEKRIKKLMNYNIKHYSNLVLSILVIVISLNSFAQTNAKTLTQIDSLANKMFVDMNNRDYDAILDMMHPKAFEMAPKDVLKNIFKSTFEGNDEFSVDIPKTIPDYKLSEVFESEDNLEYAFVSYDMSMKMTFHKQEFDEEAKQMMTTVMKAKGMDVSFLTNNTLSIVMKNRLTIILRDDFTEDKWVMLNYDPDSPLFYQIVPEGISETARVYRQNLMEKRSHTNN